MGSLYPDLEHGVTLVSVGQIVPVSGEQRFCGPDVRGQWWFQLIEQSYANSGNPSVHLERGKHRRVSNLGPATAGDHIRFLTCQKAEATAEHALGRSVIA